MQFFEMCEGFLDTFLTQDPERRRQSTFCHCCSHCQFTRLNYKTEMPFLFVFRWGGFIGVLDTNVFFVNPVMVD